jgi:hypothetical protein
MKRTDFQVMISGAGAFFYRRSGQQHVVPPDARTYNQIEEIVVTTPVTPTFTEGEGVTVAPRAALRGVQ